MSKFFKEWVMRNLTDEQLDALCQEIYDQWCWESGSKDDRAIYELADDERQRRKLPPIKTTLTMHGLSGTVTISPEDDTMEAITISVLDDADA